MPLAAEIRRAWEALPWAEIKSLPLGKRPLILAPHPDDESLGCGGLIAAYCATGQPPIVAILTDGSNSHPNLDEAGRPHLRRQRAFEARQATAHLGLPEANLKLLGFPDLSLEDFSPACVALLTDLARANACDTIVSTSLHDPHPDHQAAAAIAQQVAAAVPLRRLSYPTWAWVVPPDTHLAEKSTQGWRLDISPYLPAKRHAIVSHASQYFGLPGDPQKACLPAELLAVAQRPYEVILTA